MNVRESIIPALVKDWSAVLNLSFEEFEELVFDRLLVLGLQAVRIGSSREKDGGIDIVFWTQGLFPITCAVQVKHHRSFKKKTGSSVVRDLRGATALHHFNMGLIVTNTDFTADARHEAGKAGSSILLRNGTDLQNWVNDDFTVEQIRLASRTIEFCKDKYIILPQFL